MVARQLQEIVILTCSELVTIMFRSFLAIIAVSMAFEWTVTAAQGRSEPVRQDCVEHIGASSGLHFRDELHRLWWRRFWTGSCDGLGVFQCLSGEPSWNQSINSLLGKVSVNDRPAMLAQVCALGHDIGFEWAKDNNIRCIDTNDVKAWGSKLEKTSRPLETVRELSALAKSKLNCR